MPLGSLYIVLEELIREFKVCLPSVHPRVVMSASVIGHDCLLVDNECEKMASVWEQELSVGIREVPRGMFGDMQGSERHGC
jgi:hypothetical protein